MPSFTTTQDRSTITVQTAEIELAFSLDDGGLRMLRRLDGPGVPGPRTAGPSLDIQAGEAAAWLAERVFVRYLNHTVEERDGAVEVVIITGIGPFIVYDRYHITGTLIARRVTVKNVSDDELLLRAVRLALPGMRVHDSGHGLLEAPGNLLRPHLPLQAGTEHPSSGAASGRDGDLPLEEAPTLSTGLVALHDSAAGGTVLCWYYSEIEPAQPRMQIRNDTVTVVHDMLLADRLRSEVALSGGTQYILLVRDAWPHALTAFRQTLPLIGVRPAISPAPWVRDAALYEAHPAQFGGFNGLTNALATLRSLGINTLCLMPIWAFHNRKEQLWDGNWYDSGNPYVVCDFERIDPTLGTPDDLRRLVDTAHALGMRVLLDLPLGGCDANARYIAEHPDWFCWDVTGQLYASAAEPDLRYFDWAAAAPRQYLLDQMCQHARACDLDGYRVIMSRHTPPNWSRGLLHHASAGSLAVLHLLDQLRHELQTIKPDAALLSGFGGPIYTASADFMCDEMAHRQFLRTALNQMAPVELGDWLRDHAGALAHEAVRVCFTENYNTRLLNPIADGLRGSCLSRMLQAGLVLCGFVPLFHAGQESADEAFIRRLLHMREAYPALRYGAIGYNQVPCSSDRVFIVVRTRGNQVLLGVLNIGPHKHTATLQVPVDALGLGEADYMLAEVLSGKRWNEEGLQTWRREELAALRLTLEPFGAYCFLVQPVPQDRPAPDTRSSEQFVEVAHDPALACSFDP